MTARRRTIEAVAEQERLIAALQGSGDTHVAARLQRCMAAMTTRRQGAGWPWMCRGSGGCVWCRQALGRRWWRGLRHWIMEGGGAATLAVVPLPHSPGGLRPAVRRLRRAVRDVRDRAARRRRAWRAVAIAGMAAGDDQALLLVRRRQIDPEEVAEVFEARWPDAFVGPVGAVEPSWSLTTEDAAELARVRRGVEPLRIVVPPQRVADTGARHRHAALEMPVSLEPMPVAF